MAVTPWVPLLEAGAILVQGETHRDWLQRLLAGDVRPLAPGRAVLAALTNPQGRWLDLLLLLAVEGGVLLLTLPGRAAATLTYLRRRVLFGDRVTLADRSAAWQQADLLDDPAPPETPLAVQPLAGGGWAVRLPPAWGGGVRLVWPAAGPAPARLPTTPPWDEAAYAAWRVERGVPGPPELHEPFTPWETGPYEAVSLNKGCFPGQEVLARQVHYGKVVRGLVRLQAVAPLTGPVPLRTPEGREAGQVTTVAGRRALGVVRRSYAVPGVTLLAGEVEVQVEAALVPFAPGEKGV